MEGEVRGRGSGWMTEEMRNTASYGFQEKLQPRVSAPSAGIGVHVRGQSNMTDTSRGDQRGVSEP